MQCTIWAALLGLRNDKRYTPDCIIPYTVPTCTCGINKHPRDQWAAKCGPFFFLSHFSFIDWTSLPAWKKLPRVAFAEVLGSASWHLSVGNKITPASAVPCLLVACWVKHCLRRGGKKTSSGAAFCAGGTERFYHCNALSGLECKTRFLFRG